MAAFKVTVTVEPCTGNTPDHTVDAFVNTPVIVVDIPQTANGCSSGAEGTATSAFADETTAVQSASNMDVNDSSQPDMENRLAAGETTTANGDDEWSDPEPQANNAWLRDGNGKRPFSTSAEGESSDSGPQTRNTLSPGKKARTAPFNNGVETDGATAESNELGDNEPQPSGGLENKPKLQLALLDNKYHSYEEINATFCALEDSGIMCIHLSHSHDVKLYETMSPYTRLMLWNALQPLPYGNFAVQKRGMVFLCSKTDGIPHFEIHGNDLTSELNCEDVTENPDGLTKALLEAFKFSDKRVAVVTKEKERRICEDAGFQCCIL